MTYFSGHVHFKLSLDTVSSSFRARISLPRVLRGCFHGRWNLRVKSLGLSTCAETWILPYLNTGLGFGAASALQVGARLKGGILSCAGVGGALVCVVIGKKFSDHLVVWEEVRNKRSQYRQLSTRLECLKETVERDLKKGILLTRMPDLEKAILVLLTILIACASIFLAYILVKWTVLGKDSMLYVGYETIGRLSLTYDSYARSTNVTEVLNRAILLERFDNSLTFYTANK